MKFVFASDSFKGSLSSEKIIDILTAVAQKHFPDCETASILTADGGEGTVDAVLAGTGGELVSVSVHDPLGRPITASYGRINETSAVIEMAAASGLPLLSESERNPLLTSTYGTGELIAHALENGATDLTIAIGGSATNDGGMGALCALGVRFLDAEGNSLSGIGADLEKVADIDLSGLHPLAKTASFTVMCDVNNPLVGERGATYVFGPQKGATPDVAKRLEAGMQNYAAVIERVLGVSVSSIAGGGAAGGLGAALLVFLGAKMNSGIDTLLDLVKFDFLLSDADFVITGEGRMDSQSAGGKVACGVGLRCKEAGVPAFAIVGGMGAGADAIYDCGICSILPTVNAPMPLSEAIERAEELYENAAERLFRLIKAATERR